MDMTGITDSDYQTSLADAVRGRLAEAVLSTNMVTGVDMPINVVILEDMTTNTGNDPTTMSVASAVRAELSRQDKPKTAIAAVIGVTRPTAYSRLRGDTPFTTKELGLVAEYLGMTTYNLMASAEMGDRFAEGKNDPEASRVSPPQQDAWAQPSRAKARRA